MDGISRATVPSSGYFLSKACSTFLSSVEEGLEGEEGWDWGTHKILGQTQHTLPPSHLPKSVGETTQGGKRQTQPSSNTGLPGLASPGRGGVASAATMLKNKELKPTLQGIWPWILTLGAGTSSASEVPVVSGPRGTQNWRPQAQLPPGGNGKGKAAATPRWGVASCRQDGNFPDYLVLDPDKEE